MKNEIVIEIVVSLLLGILGYVASGNIIVGVLSTTLPLAYFFIIANKMLKRYSTKISRYHECYHFINSFIVSLSIKKVTLGAYESAIANMREDFLNEFDNMSSLSQKEKLEHLSKYFRFHDYYLFVDLVNLYEEQGGNILEMSHHLINNTRQTEEYIAACSSIHNKTLTQFGILWLLTLGIMAFLRFALSTFFVMMAKQIFYPIGIGMIILFCLVSIHIALTRLTKVEIRGWNDVEKI